MKYLWIFVILCAFFPSANVIGEVKNDLKTADSLFAIGLYDQAGNIFKKKLNSPESGNGNILLKLAYIAEKAGNYTDCLYYLSKLAEVRPSLPLFQEMEALASRHHLVGYEFDDYGYFSILYRRYGHFLHLLLLTLGVYVFAVLVIKIRKGEHIQTRHKWILFLYLAGILALITVPDFYSGGIIRNDGTYVRSYPSSAAPVATRINKGNKVIILNTKDNWYMVLWEKDLVYIRRNDVLTI